MKQMNHDELQQHDGTGDKKTYLAFQGKVYDVTDSKLWRNGLHLKSHHAGQDLTDAMKAAPHGPSVIERFEQVGELIEEKVPSAPSTAFKTPPKLFEMILSQHPHPITVHFPIALCIAAAVFTLLGLVFKVPSLEKAALYNIIFALLTTPGSIFTGLLSWYYNYSGIWTHIYRVKTYLSILLVVFLVSALSIYFLCLSGLPHAGPWYWVYSLIVLAQAPTVIGLGYFGGKITFPS
ncbi:cytochrome b5 domain-containing protein [Gemmatimonadota bacterium]